MSFSGCHLAQRLTGQRVQEGRRQTELRRLQRKARRAHPGLLSHQSHWFPYQLGSPFVSLRVRLPHAGMRQPHPVWE
jgi:hypothetical protein